MLEDKQREFLTGPSKRVILNCTRQWGKSWMAAMALLFHALHHPDLLSLVARPTLRKSAELLKKVKDLTSRIGLSIKGEFVAGFPVSQCSHLRSQALKSIVSIGGLHRHCGASISAQNLPLATKRTGRCGVGLTNSGDSQVVR